MKLPNRVQLAKGVASFNRYEDGNLWYDLVWSTDDQPEILYTFQFPIEVVGTTDAGGSFKKQEKGIALLRWSFKHLEQIIASIQDEEQD